MKYVCILSLASLLVICAALAQAQSLTTSGSPFYSADEYQRAHSLFDKLHSDLQDAKSSAPEALITRADDQLDALENNWDNAVYSSSQMIATITDLEAVVNHSTSFIDRANLGGDVSRLLDLRQEYY